MRILKLIIALAIGMTGGLSIAGAGLYFIEDMPVSVFLDKLAAFGALRFIGIFLSTAIATALAVYLQIILHEGGHLVCGLATGYKFVSFRIFSLTIIRKDGKLCLRRFCVDGTGGQCLLTPPDLPFDKIPTMLYNLGGVMSNIMFSIIAVVLLVAIDDMPDLLMMFLVMFTIMGVIMALMNGIPMNIGGISNDAKNALMLGKDLKSKQIFVTQLRTNALVQNGVRPKDMPGEWFMADGEIDYSNALQASARIMYAGWLIDKEQWQEAYEVLEDMEAHKDKIVGLFANELDCELIFTALVTGKTERAKELLTDKLLTYINRFKGVMSSKQRLLCAMALYIDQDAAKAKEIYDNVCAKSGGYLMQGEVISDIAIMKSMLIPSKG